MRGLIRVQAIRADFTQITAFKSLPGKRATTKGGHPLKTRSAISLLGVCVSAAAGFALLFAKSTGGASSALAKVVEVNRKTVVVELFTSEGCSSCPPADRLLSSLAIRQPIEGAEIIPLSEHVDYWNRLGWTDPFSSALFSDRQRSYARWLKTEPYTPQMVINGASSVVGSDQARALAAISGEISAPNLAVSIVPVESGNPAPKDSLSFSITVKDLSRLELRGKADVVLAITEDDLESKVGSGENSGRHLAHSGVVRILKTVSAFDLQGDTRVHVQPEITVSSAWKRRDLRAVVFVQHELSGRILGAAATPAADL